MCFDDPEDSYRDSPPPRPQMRNSGFVFSFKRFPPRMSHFPRLSGCKERQVYVASRCWGGCLPPLSSRPLCFLWALPSVLHRGRVRESTSEELHMSLQPLPPLSTHQKDPKLL